MTTVQLVGVRSGVAIVQRDDDVPVEMTWGCLHEAQYQEGVIGYVYRWLLMEFCRCEYEQRQGRSWQSPRLEIGEIERRLREKDAHEAIEAETARQKRLAKLEEQERQRERERELSYVRQQRQMTGPDSHWWPIPYWEVPQEVRFDTPRRNQGQIVEVSFGTFGRAEADDGDPYMKITDHSDGSVSCYKRLTRDVPRSADASPTVAE